MTVQKVDYKKEFEDLYRPPADRQVLITVPAMNFLMVEGQGGPVTAKEYIEAIQALYSVAYQIKFVVRERDHWDYVVPPLEGLWWTDNPSEFSVQNRDIWKWTLMIMQPESVSIELVDRALVLLKQKKKDRVLPALSKLRFGGYEEGLCAQILHIGPYDAEESCIAGLHRFIQSQGFELRGRHHEIYLSDARKVAPEKLKTIIRQPIEKRD